MIPSVISTGPVSVCVISWYYTVISTTIFMENVCSNATTSGHIDFFVAAEKNTMARCISTWSRSLYIVRRLCLKLTVESVTHSLLFIAPCWLQALGNDLEAFLIWQQTQGEKQEVVIRGSKQLCFVQYPLLTRPEKTESCLHSFCATCVEFSGVCAVPLIKNNTERK